ncbi:MAG: hypothetical protein ABI690_15430 [Chloroflexota bacterium]
MPVHMVWEDEQHTIVRCDGEGKWTWEEYHATLSEIVEAVQQVDHRVDLVITREEGSSSPAGSPMPHFQRAMRIMPRNMSLVILINTNSFGRALVTMFSRIFASREHAQLVVVGSLEEARARIASSRASEKNEAQKVS